MVYACGNSKRAKDYLSLYTLYVLWCSKRLNVLYVICLKQNINKIVTTNNKKKREKHCGIKKKNRWVLVRTTT